MYPRSAIRMPSPFLMHNPFTFGTPIASATSTHLLQPMSEADAYTLRGKSLDGPVEGDLGTASNFPAATPSPSAPVGRASSRSRLVGFVGLGLALVLAGVVAAVVVVTRSPGAAPSLRVADESLLRAASPPEMQFNVMVRRRRSQ